jgi:hypothetical protein
MLSHFLRAVKKPTLSYITNSNVAGVASSSKSVTGINIGVAASDRVLVVGIQGFSGSTATRTLNSVTVDGVSATVIQSIAAAYAGGIVYINKPTGTTANISATFSGSMTNVTFFVYRLTGLMSSIPQDFDTAGGTPSVTINTTQQGVGVAIFKASTAGTFSGVTSNATINPDGRPQQAGSTTFTSNSATISVSGVTLSRLYVASWR